MGIDVRELERLAGVVPTDGGYHSYRQAVGAETLGEDISTGAKGWLSGVIKALGTWKSKMQKGGATPAQMSALDGVEAAIRAAMGKLGEGVEGLDKDDVPARAKLKKDMGAEAVCQNYKGTGKQKYRRLL